MKTDLETLASQLYAAYRSTFQTEQPHRPFIVTFSAVPGSGKTTLAKRLTSQLGWWRFCRDDIRRLIVEQYPELVPLQATELLNAVNRLFFRDFFRPENDQRLILDSSCDRTYDATRDIVGWEIPVFVIRIDPVWDELMLRIRARGDNISPSQSYMDDMPRLHADWLQFGERSLSDVTWTQSTESLEAITSRVIRVLSDRIAL